MTPWSGSPEEPAGDPIDPAFVWGPPAALHPPAYPPFPVPGPPDPAYRRPGPPAASAVLAFVDAGLLVLSGVLLLLGASLAASIADTVGDSSSAYAAEFAVDGVLDLVAAGLLVAGGVNLLGRRVVGRSLLIAGAGTVLAEGLYWPVRFPVGAVPTTIVWDVLFSGLAVLVLVFALVPPVSRWLVTPRA